MSVTAWKICGTGADDATVGTTAWTNPGNITAVDTVYASNANIVAAQSHYIKGTNFGFTATDIPAGATINGIEFRMTRKSNTGTSTDASMKVVKGGTISGTDQSKGAAWPNGVDEQKLFGGVAELFDLTWLQTDIVGVATFGAVLSANSGGAATMSVDAFECRVYFTALNVPNQTRVLSAHKAQMRPPSRGKATAQTRPRFSRVK